MPLLIVDAATAAALAAELEARGQVVARAASVEAGEVLAEASPGAVVVVEDGYASRGVARFVELLGDGFCVIDGEGRMVHSNGGVERMLGYSVDEAAGFGFMETVHPEDIAGAAREMASLLSGEGGGGESGFELRLRAKDGSWRRLHWQTRYFADEGLIYALARDVTPEREASERLRHSEAVMAEAQRIGRFGSWELTLDDGLLESPLRWSDETYRIFGHEPGAFELTVARFMEQVHPGDREAVASETQASIDRGERYAIDHRIVLPDGRVRHVHEAALPSREANTGRRRLIGTVHDITDRKDAEQRLTASRQRAQLLSMITNDAIWAWDLETDEIVWSDGYAALFGFSDVDDATIAGWRRRLHAEDAVRVEASLARAVGDEGARERWQEEYRFARADGSYAWVLDRGYVVRDDRGRATAMHGGMTDVTWMREADERIREQAALLDKARDAILVRDLAGRVTFWNASAERLYGWSAAEAVGRSVRELIDKDHARYDKAQQMLLADGEWDGELVHTTRDGRRVTVEGRWTLVGGRGGAADAVLVINTDVTERKKLEAQFLRAQRMESIGTLAGGIAHDLNNVLAPILMSVDLLRLSVDDPEVGEVLTAVERSARRGADLVRQVLSFARGVEGERVVVDPRQLVRDVSRIALETMPRSIEVDATAHGDVWGVVGDATQLHQVLINLCVNARDAMPNGGTLRIATDNIRLDTAPPGAEPAFKPGRYVVVTISDTGHGMPPEVLARVFEPFFTTKPIGKGTGLGLATVQAIVKSHGGWMTVYSEPGQGSVFRVYLPAADRSPEESEQVPLVELPRGDGELILVVDDEAAIRMITRQTLEAFGYRVVTAQDGAEALAVFVQNEREVAVVLTDMMMPIMDGAATIRALQRLRPDVRIIAASGLNANGGVAKAAGAGIRHFLAKPYTTEALLKTVAEILAG